LSSNNKAKPSCVAKMNRSNKQIAQLQADNAIYQIALFKSAKLKIAG